MLERLFGSGDSGIEFNNPKQKYGGPTDPNDCLSCRAMGSIAMTSLGIYTYHSGMRNLQAQRAIIEASKSKYKYGSRQLGIVTISLSLIGAGVWRAFN